MCIPSVRSLSKQSTRSLLYSLIAATSTLALAADDPSNDQVRKMEERLRGPGGGSEALEELAAGTPESLAMTLGLMKSGDEVARGMAYIAVARSRPQDARVLPALIEGLDRVASMPGWTVLFDHDEGYELSVAIYSMGKEAFPVALENALVHRRPAGRATAALALGLFLDGAEYTEAMTGRPPHPERFTLPEDAADELMRFAEVDDYAPMRVAACDCLSRAGLEGERRGRFDRILVAGLRSSEGRVVVAALEAIDSTRPPSPAFVEPLLELLRQPLDGPDAWRVPRYEVVSVLGRMGRAAASAVPPLRELLQRGDIDEKEAVIRAFRAIGPDVEGVPQALNEAVPALRRSLQVVDGDRPERGRAIQGLRTIGLEVEGVREALRSIVPELAEQARSQDREVRSNAISELKSIGSEVDGVSDALRAAVQTLQVALRLGDEARSGAITDLRWGIGLEFEGVRDALKGLLPELREELRDDDPATRHSAVLALGSIGYEIDGVAEAIESARTDLDEIVRQEAERSIRDERETLERASKAEGKSRPAPPR